MYNRRSGNSDEDTSRNLSQEKVVSVLPIKSPVLWPDEPSCKE